MAIYQLLQNKVFEPEDIQRLSAAYELTLRALSLQPGNDPLTQMIAREIIEIGKTGIEDPKQTSELAIRQLGLP
jgi:hypothetical protein